MQGGIRGTIAVHPVRRRLLGPGLLIVLLAACAGPGASRAQLPASVSVVGADGGDRHLCVVDDEHLARCLGANEFGQSGDGDARLDRSIAQPVVGLTDVVEVSAGRDFSCARTAAGQVACWGQNLIGQIGNGLRFSAQLVPSPVEGLPDALTDITTGANHACAGGAAGAWCWGDGRVGQLGNGDRLDRSRPSEVAGLGPVVALAAGANHTCALDPSGAVRCWGAGDQGQLGDGEVVDRARPVAVGGLAPATAIAAGGETTCAIAAGGEVWCWGAGRLGQTGPGGEVVTTRPVPVPLPSPADQVAVAEGHACARLEGGVVWCWGDGRLGQRGPDVDGAAPSPLPLPGGAQQVAVEVARTCAVVRGQLRCWPERDA
ncbi:MAG: hypothetical protein R2711_09585 [Acidimicrobiales bacterium]